MAALIALVVAVTGLAQSGEGHALLRKAGLFQPPVTYTALAFTHPQSLPARLATRRATVSVSFTIHNASDVPRAYQWSIVTVRAGQRRTMADGRVATAAGGYATVERPVATSCVGGRLQVVARLAAPSESIDFWVACWSGKGHRS